MLHGATAYSRVLFGPALCAVCGAFELELAFEQIQTNMIQKLLLWVEVGKVLSIPHENTGFISGCLVRDLWACRSSADLFVCRPAVDLHQHL
jgi:hypothetical protein